ncbi:hypothetical protein Sjap_003976 [Stephania japonica]|uniref:Uncharacterized protein n=1 Tax=Stephania japonica TaxID=461633 RepID=A0AAP0K1F3_9MAGN
MFFLSNDPLQCFSYALAALLARLLVVSTQLVFAASLTIAIDLSKPGYGLLKRYLEEMEGLVRSI